MSRFSRGRGFRNVAMCLAGGAVIVLGVAWLQALAKLDPFADRRQIDTEPLGDKVAIRMQDVEMRQYEGPKLTASARIGSIAIKDNRQEVSLFAVSDGRYYASKGNFAFTSERVDWNAVTQTAAFIGAGAIRNKDVDLKAANFTYNEKQRMLDIPGKVSGRFFDGKVQADGLRYDLAKDSFATGPVKWAGLMPNPFQQAGGPPARSRWKVDFPGGTEIVNGLQKAPKGGWATDGEIKVIADYFERDMKTDVLTAKGNVRYYSAKANLTAEAAIVDRKAKKATLTGKVDMLLKPKDREVLEEIEIPPFRPTVPDQISKERPPAPVTSDEDREVSSTKNIRKYPVTATAEKVEYWYARGARRAVITGSPQAQQELPGGRWRYVWAARAEYDGEKELLRLISGRPNELDVRMKNSRGEDLRAAWFEISTQEDVEEWRAGRFAGELYSDEDEDEAANLRRWSKKPPAPAGSGGLRGPIGGNRRPG